jgi:hypothetical protein
MKWDTLRTSNGRLISAADPNAGDTSGTDGEMTDDATGTGGETGAVPRF